MARIENLIDILQQHLQVWASARDDLDLAILQKDAAAKRSAEFKMANAMEAAIKTNPETTTEQKQRRLKVLYEVVGWNTPILRGE